MDGFEITDYGFHDIEKIKIKEMEAMTLEAIIRKELSIAILRINKKDRINFKLIDLFHQKKEYK